MIISDEKLNNGVRFHKNRAKKTLIFPKTDMKKTKKKGTSSTRVIRKTCPKVSPRCQKVAVLFAVNNGYAPYLGVALASLVEYAGKHEYELIVLHHDLNERNRELLERVVDQFGRESAGSFQLRFMEMPLSMADYNFAPGYKPLSVECWYRLFAPSLFPEYDKMLWLDSDILVRDDVAKLYATNMRDKWIAACRWDYGIIGILERERRQNQPKLEPYFTKVLGVKRPKENYVNSGVMLFNLRAMREQNVQAKLLQAAQNPAMYFHDQCAINMVCQEHILYIDSEWNGLASFLLEDLPPKYRHKALSDRINRRTIHWAGSMKPWRSPLALGADEWWDVARRTPYYEHILYSNICALLRGETNKKFTKLGKTFLEQL